MSRPDDFIAETTTEVKQWCLTATHEAYQFGKDTTEHPDARLRQIGVAADGFVVGGIKQAPSKLFTWETAGKAAVSAGIGCGIGAALALESPLIAGGLAVVGTVGLFAAVADTWNKLGQDKDFRQAMDNVWKSGDQKSMTASIKMTEAKLGAVGFDTAITTASGGGGYLAGRFGATSIIKALASRIGIANSAINIAAESNAAHEILSGSEEQLLINRFLGQAKGLIPDGIKLVSAKYTSSVKDSLTIHVAPENAASFSNDEESQLLRLATKLTFQEKRLVICPIFRTEEELNSD